MNKIMLVAAFFIAGCGARGDASESSSKHKPDDPSYVIDSSVGSLADLFVGMTESELMSIKRPMVQRTIIQEGDAYKVVSVTLGDGVVVDCVFDLQGILHRFSSTSRKVHDADGSGVGTSLSELKRRFPKGRLVMGEEDARYINFVSGSRVLFELDQAGIRDSCFDASEHACDIADDVKVVRIVVNRDAAAP